MSVENGLAYFSTVQGKAKVASCALNETQEFYSISLGNSNGRALYSLLVTALGSNLPVTITSADDCAGTEGVERAKEVTVVKQGSAGASGKALYVYKGDGVTKLGRLLDIENANVRYIPSDNPITALYIRNTAKATIYYTTSDCTGEAWGVGSSQYYFFSEHVFDGNSFRKSNRHDGNKIFKSVIYAANGSCQSTSITSVGYPLVEEPHPSCGEKPCLYIED